MNYFPFTDFVALRSHTQSFGYVLHIWGSSWGVPSSLRVPQRRKGSKWSPGKRACRPEATSLPSFGRKALPRDRWLPHPPSLAVLPRRLLIFLSPCRVGSCSRCRCWVALVTAGACSPREAGPQCTTWQPSFARRLLLRGLEWPFRFSFHSP